MRREASTHTHTHNTRLEAFQLLLSHRAPTPSPTYWHESYLHINEHHEPLLPIVVIINIIIRYMYNKRFARFIRATRDNNNRGGRGVAFITGYLPGTLMRAARFVSQTNSQSLDGGGRAKKHSPNTTHATSYYLRIIRIGEDAAESARAFKFAPRGAAAPTIIYQRKEKVGYRLSASFWGHTRARCLPYVCVYVWCLFRAYLRWKYSAHTKMHVHLYLGRQSFGLNYIWSGCNIIKMNWKASRRHHAGERIYIIMCVCVCVAVFVSVIYFFHVYNEPLCWSTLNRGRVFVYTHILIW